MALKGPIWSGNQQTHLSGCYYWTVTPIRDYNRETHPAHWGPLQMRGSKEGVWFEWESERKKDKAETQGIR